MWAFSLFIGYRGVAQPGSASALGAEGRRFESVHPDQSGNPYRLKKGRSFGFFFLGER